MTENMPETPSFEEAARRAADLRKQRWILAGIIAGAVILVAAIIVAVIFLVKSPTVASNVRDIFIIFMALESLVIGAALVILIIQLSILINLLQNEIKPILETTNETVNTLKGTTTFLSSTLVGPVIKMNEYLAGLKKLIDLLFVSKR